MFCAVYRLYQGGDPIPKERLRILSARRGTLQFERVGNVRDGAPRGRRAVLINSDGKLELPPLLDAMVVKIDGHGIRINGIEYVRYGSETARFVQAWIVKQI